MWDPHLNNPHYVLNMRGLDQIFDFRQPFILYYFISYEDTLEVH